jgi:signal transduction histidine kinase
LFGRYLSDRRFIFCTFSDINELVLNAPDNSKILVVNDNQDSLELAETILRQAGYEVLTGKNGFEGLETARRKTPDLIISDVMMPVMDGVELCRQLRADEALTAIPIILISAVHKDSESVVAGLEAGADDYIEVPYEPMHLIAKVARLLERRHYIRLLEQSKESELKKMNESLLAEIEVRKVAERQVKELLRRLVDIQENERKRFARELHDQIGQQITAFRLKLEMAGARLDETQREILEQIRQADRIAAEIDTGIEFMAWEMRPVLLDELGLESALDRFVREWSEHFGIAAEFHSRVGTDRRFAAGIETNLYRILQEALQNVYKHACAKHVSVIFNVRNDLIKMVIEDDGDGYDATRPVENSGNGGMGFVNMRERAGLLGGTLEIESSPGSGTTIFISVPLEYESPEIAPGHIVPLDPAPENRTG